MALTTTSLTVTRVSPKMIAFVFTIQVLSIIMFNIPLTSTGDLPGGSFESDTTTCEEFSRFARFNPYSVVSDEWMVFYYWAPPRSGTFVKFNIPTNKQVAYLKYILDGHVQKPIDWTARSLLMIERNNSTYFLVERNDRGHYYLYEPYKGMKTGDILEAFDIRIKQTSDNKYIGIMECLEEHVFLFARIKDIPKKKDVQEEAAKLGYRGRGGRSYLYQGHSWMPIPEADDEQFEDALLNRHKYLPKIRQ